MAEVFWSAGVDGDFADASDWSTGSVPGSADEAFIQATGTYTVTSSADETVQSLTLGQSAVFALAGGTFTLSPITLATPELTIGPSATLDVADGAILQVFAGTISLAGAINVAAGGELLFLGGGSDQAEISHTGTIALAGAGSEINVKLGTFTNFATIEGAGTIQMAAAGSQASEFQNESGGVIDADLAASTLAFAGGIPINNYGGTLEATGGGSLALTDETIHDDATGNPLGIGVMQALGAGSRVNLDNSFIYSGTLVTSGGGAIRTVGGTSTLYGYEELPVDVAGSVLVGDATTLSLAGTIDNSGVISLASNGDATELRLETIGDLGARDTPPGRKIFLTGDGAITLSDSADNLIDATDSTAVAYNDGETISGAGQIGGGSKLKIYNDGVIDATGVNALVVNVASGDVSDEVHGFLEGAGSGGLSLAGGSFKIIGTVEALNGSSVTFGAGAALSNSANGTLTGGVWDATDTGGGATLDLNGTAITTDAAKITLSGAGSVFETGSTTLEASLTTIASAGKLELLADRAWSSGLALEDDGLLQLGGGGFDAAALTVGSGAEVTGFGSIASPLANAGVVQAYRGDLVLAGSITGSGTLKVYGSSTLEIGGSLASSQGVAFATGVHALLKLDDPSAFASTITDLGLGDTIDLASTDATGAQITGDTLAITLMGAGTLNYSLTDPGSNVRIVLSSDGSGGTDLTLYKETAKSVVKMSERMAGVGAVAGTGLPTHPAEGAPSLVALVLPGAS